MQFSVSQLLQEPVGATRQYDIVDESLDLDEGLRATGITGEIKLTRLNQGRILATGSFKASVVMPCSRCLQPAEIHVSFELEAEYQPSIDVLTGLPQEQPEDQDLVFSIDANHYLDLSEALRQHILVALPMQPLCRPDCKGLCSQCGQDLNISGCDCAQPEIDERWAGLADLLKTQ
jgi:uncharacterized protein